MHTYINMIKQGH